MKCGLEAAFKNIGKAIKAAEPRNGYQWFVKYPQGSKLAEYSSSYRRTENEREKELKSLLSKAMQLQERKRYLQEKLEDLDKIASGKQELPHDDATDSSEPKSDGKVTCLSCFDEVDSASFAQHISQCYKKTESHISIISPPENQVGNVLCALYDRHAKEHCSRLRFSCPFHLKDPKPADDAMCNFPLNFWDAGVSPKVEQEPQQAVMLDRTQSDPTSAAQQQAQSAERAGPFAFLFPRSQLDMLAEVAAEASDKEKEAGVGKYTRCTRPAKKCKAHAMWFGRMKRGILQELLNLVSFPFLSCSHLIVLFAETYHRGH